MEKLTNKELAQIEAALYDVAELLIKYENLPDKYDRIFIRDMTYCVNELLGGVKAYSLGYRQEV